MNLHQTYLIACGHTIFHYMSNLGAWVIMIIQCMNTIVSRWISQLPNWCVCSTAQSLIILHISKTVPPPCPGNSFAANSSLAPLLPMLPMFTCLERIVSANGMAKNSLLKQIAVEWGRLKQIASLQSQPFQWRLPQAQAIPCINLNHWRTNRIIVVFDK